MKIIVSKEELLNGINIVSKAVPSHSNMQVLECILIKANNNVITLTGNDGEFGIETEIKGEIVDEGKVALAAKLFSEIIRKYPDGQNITIDVEGNFTTHIVSSNIKTNIKGQEGNDYTPLPNIKRTESFLLSELSLKDVIRQIIFCIGENNNNKIITSVYFKIKGDELDVVALDGFRIGYRKISLKNTYPEVGLIIPGKSLNEMSKILNSDADNDVVVYYDKNHVLFEVGKTKIVSNTVEGEYLEYELLFSPDYETKVNLNKKELLDSIDRTTVMIREGEVKPVIFEITDNNMNLYINTNTGENTQNIECSKSGKDIEIALRPKFMIDVLKVLDDEDITLYLTNSKSPCIIKNDAEDYKYLILPVNFVKER